MTRARKPRSRRKRPGALQIGCALVFGARFGAEGAAQAEAGLGPADRHPQPGAGAILAPAEGTGGAAGSGGSSGESPDSGGCSCSTDGRGGVASAFSLLMTFMLAVASARTRRRRLA